MEEPVKEIVRQVLIQGPGQAALREVPAPDPGPHDVVVRVVACGICGSDLTYIRMGGFCVTGGPMPLGHELAGVVEWVGREARGVSVGQRVIVVPGNPHVDGLDIIGNGGAEGGLTQLLLVRDAVRRNRLVEVPDALSLEVAALAEPVAVGMKAALRTDAAADDTVAVFGCGPIGLAAIATLASRGINVAGVDLSARRLELAGALGARAVFNPAEVDVWEELIALHGAEAYMGARKPGTHAFIEASGSGKALGDIIEHARVGARLSVVAVHMEPVPTNFTSVMSKELAIKGSMGYPPRFRDAIDLLCQRDLSQMITHRIPLERFDDALAVLQGDKNCGKVLVTMEEGH